MSTETANPISEIDKVSIDVEFQWLTSQSQNHIARSMDAFKLYLQLFSGAIAGAVWLSLNATKHQNPDLVLLTDGALAVLAISFSIVIWESHRAWRNYRIAQTALVPHVPKPRWFPASLAWLAMLGCILASVLVFWLLNPFA